MRIYLSSTDILDKAPLYESLVFMAKNNKMAGATVIKGVMGFGASSAVTSTRFWTVSEKLPIIVEIVDERQKIDAFFSLIKPSLERVKKGLMVSIEKTEVLLYKSGKK